MAKYKSDQKLVYKTSDEIVNFGSHNGSTISEVMKKDPGWVVWARKTCKPRFILRVAIIKEFNLDPKTYEKLD